MALSAGPKEHFFVSKRCVAATYFTKWRTPNLKTPPPLIFRFWGKFQGKFWQCQLQKWPVSFIFSTVQEANNTLSANYFHFYEDKTFTRKKPKWKFTAFGHHPISTWKPPPLLFGFSKSEGGGFFDLKSAVPDLSCPRHLGFYVPDLSCPGISGILFILFYLLGWYMSNSKECHSPAMWILGRNEFLWYPIFFKICRIWVAQKPETLIILCRQSKIPDVPGQDKSGKINSQMCPAKRNKIFKKYVKKRCFFVTFFQKPIQFFRPTERVWHAHKPETSRPNLNWCRLTRFRVAWTHLVFQLPGFYRLWYIWDFASRFLLVRHIWGEKLPDFAWLRHIQYFYYRKHQKVKAKSATKWTTLELHTT